VRLDSEIHRQQLSEFNCLRWYQQDWNEVIDYYIRQYLADHLHDGIAMGLGVVVGTVLASVLAWSEVGDPPVWESNALATASGIGFSRRGFAETLKRELIELARVADIRTVRSYVHKDNVAMISLNRKLGADITPDPDDPLGRYQICDIVV
jgi:ribosomal protein S18 acetylase RimI-like enzyme